MNAPLVEGEQVDTPYGVCIVKEVRKATGLTSDIVICTPKTWELAEYSSSQPKFYLNPADVKPATYRVGQTVISPYGGEGYVESITDSHYVVRLNKWSLADGQSPTQYLQRQAITVDKQRAENEVNWRRLLEDAVNAKDKAANFFKAKDFEAAKESYLTALTKLNGLGTELPDDFRAEVLEHTIPCHNNVALCSMKIKKYDDAVAYANNGVLLISAFETVMRETAPANGDLEQSQSNLWKQFQKRGMTYQKLTQEWKKKSLFYKGKALYLGKNYEAAIEQLGLAMEVLKLGDAKGPVIDKQIDELADLLNKAKIDKRKESKKEKETWQRAFKKNNTEPEDEPTSTSQAPLSQSQSQSPPRAAATIPIPASAVPPASAIPMNIPIVPSAAVPTVQETKVESERAEIIKVVETSTSTSTSTSKISGGNGNGDVSASSDDHRTGGEHKGGGWLEDNFEYVGIGIAAVALAAGISLMRSKK